MKALTASLFVLCLSNVVSERAYAAQSPPSAPVTVVNTTANPVPILGTTTVNGSVTIDGTPNVRVTNTPNVNVTGGTVTATAAKVTRSFNAGIFLDHGDTARIHFPAGDFAVFHLSSLCISTPDDSMEVTLLGPGLNCGRGLIGAGDSDLFCPTASGTALTTVLQNTTQCLNFPQPFDITEIDVKCLNEVTNCTFNDISGLGM